MLHVYLDKKLTFKLGILTHYSCTHKTFSVLVSKKTVISFGYYLRKEGMTSIDIANKGIA